MAKKKKSKKKFHGAQNTKKKKQQLHSSPVSQPAAAALPADEPIIDEQTVAATSEKIVQSAKKRPLVASQKAADETVEHGYVKSDLRRSFVISGLIIGVLIILWLLFEYTGLGPTIYHLVKI